MIHSALIELGPCCLCGVADATTLLQVRRRAPMAGHDWGCFVCQLPADGATAVLCDACSSAMGDVLDARGPGESPFDLMLAQLSSVCTGYPATEGRTPIADLAPDWFDHDLRKHSREEWYCRQCGCSLDQACLDNNGGTCFPTTQGICSHCLRGSQDRVKYHHATSGGA